MQTILSSGRLAARLFGGAIVAAALAAAPANAQFVSEIKGGVLAHDVDNLWSGFSLETKAVDLNVEAILSPGLPFLFGVIRPAIGATINTDGGTSHGYLDARWQIDLPLGFFFGTGVGVAIHDGELDPVKRDMKALGSRALFHIPVELGWRFDRHNSLSVYFEHTSNAGLASSNEGMDRLGIRYGYRF
jgi:hypothetical protein